MIKITRESAWCGKFIGANVTLNRTQTQKIRNGESKYFETSPKQQNALLQISCAGVLGTYNLTQVQNIEEIAFKITASDVICNALYKDGGTEYLHNQTPPPMTFVGWQF